MSSPSSKPVEQTPGGVPPIPRTSTSATGTPPEEEEKAPGLEEQDPGTQVSTSTSVTKIGSLERQARKKLLQENRARASTLRNELRAKTLLPVAIDENEWMELAEAAQYDAFDAELIKAICLERSGGKGQDLISIITAGVFFGNNFRARIPKSVDPTLLAKVTTLASAWEIQRRRINASTLVLGRILAAHAPLTYKVRQFLLSASLLPAAGFATTTPILLQDLGLTPLSDDMDNKDFLEKFTVVLLNARKNAKKDVEVTPEVAIAKMHQLRLLAVSGWKNDVHFKGMTADQWPKMSVGQVLALYGYK